MIENLSIRTWLLLLVSVFALPDGLGMFFSANPWFRLHPTIDAALLAAQIAVALKIAQTIAWSTETVAASARKIVLGNTDTRVPVVGYIELASVAKEFNQVLDAQKAAAQRQLEREFLLNEAQRIGRIGSYSLDIAADRWTTSSVLDIIFGIDHQPGGRPIGDWRSMIHQEDREAVVNYFDRAVLVDGKNFDREYRIVRPIDGIVRWVHGLGELSFGPNGSPTRMLGTIQDITERKSAQERQQLDASVFTHAREGIAITDPLGSIIDVNDMFTKITGYGREEVLGKNPRILHSGIQSKEFYENMWHSLKTKGHWSGEIWNRRKNGELYAELLTISAVPDHPGNTLHYVALFSDITFIKEHQSQLEHIAHYDTLTNLPNRLLLNDRLRQALAQSLRRKQSLAVAFLDLDNIKGVNDTYGHQAGDTVLTTLCERMKEALREGDTLARIGGDEFVVVMVDLPSRTECLIIVERLLAVASTPVELHNYLGAGKDETTPHTVHVSASIGVTFYPQDDVDADVLLRHADQAMYLAKQAGKNRYHIFDIANDVAIHSKHEEINRIAEALRNNEFVLHYQPKVDLSNNDVIGVEALIRWQHPQRGLLMPNNFLPTIEGHQLSIEIGEWVIDQAMTDMDMWLSHGLDLTASVNICALQLQHEYFPDRLRIIMDRHPGMKERLFQLEILETSALQDLARVSAVIRVCLDLGVTFALDDFGTGYSSLSYLKNLPAGVLKIDQSFIRNIAGQSEDQSIVKGIIGLASVFQRQVIAEGVESQAHGDLLLSMGCLHAQGFGIAEPMPADDIPAWTEIWQHLSPWRA